MSEKQKYKPLKDYLMNCNSNSVKLSYQEIEKIIGNPLPNSANKYKEWWSNGGHSQADAWLDAGWRVNEINLGNYIVFKKSPSKPRNLKLGKIYRHFKGNNYLALHLAKHSETLEEIVVYQALYGENGIWVRPLSMFLEKVEVNGELVNRFEEVTE